MCGRYQFLTDGSAELRAIRAALRQQSRSTGWSGGEIFPTANAPVLLEAGEELAPALLCWGFPWRGHRPVINARCETVLERPMFQESVRRRRCAVPASGFYEWDRDKHKYLFRLPGREALYMAGFHDVRDGLHCYCILTTVANESMRDVHDRMPLVLTREQTEPWIRNRDAAEALLRAAPPALERTREDGQLQLW